MFEIPILFKLIWLLDSNHYHLELWANPKQKTQLSHDSFLKFSLSAFEVAKALVTQPMLQRRPNPTELRSMDY